MFCQKNPRHHQQGEGGKKMSNFQCPQCGMVNIDCGKEGYKTPKELRYEKALEEIEEYCNNVLSFTAVRTTESDILNIINKAKDGE